MQALIINSLTESHLLNYTLYCYMIKFYTFLLVLFSSVLGFAQQNFNSNESETETINSSVSDTNNNVITEQANELVFIRLSASAIGNSYNTDIYFNDNASRGFDLGYDASFFGPVPDFAIYSLVVENNTGIPLAIQAVNTSDLLGVTIPLGVNADAGTELTIRIASSTIPATTNVYLDDTVLNTSTLLNTTDYVITPSSSLSGSGRYFLRVSEPAVTYTFNESWSPSDPNGIASASDDIVIVSGDASININTICNSAQVNPGASLTIDSGITFTTSNGITLESNSTSYSSLISNGIVSGTISYERYVNSNSLGNDLISAPLAGQTWSSFLSPDNAEALLDNGSGIYAFAPFDKTTGDFENYEVGTTANLTSGAGYRAATDSGTTLRFTGTLPSNTVSVDITNSGPNYEEWNLVGNPYPAYLNVHQFLLHDVGGTINLSLFDSGSAAIYGYDGNAVNGWTIYNLATTTASTVITPGQGFFVSANTINNDLYDLEFTSSMQTTGTSDDFILGRNTELTYLKLNLNSNSEAFTTEFYFNANASSGFDLGYDANVFGNTPDFALYSHLIQDNSGHAIALQTLNTSDVLNSIIPLGVNANQGEQITFSISDSTLPDTINVYLDDTLANTTTLLNVSNYVISPETPLSGTGRFYLRTAENALSTVENSLETLNVFALNNSKEIVVNGVLHGTNVLHLYDIQGRLVLNHLLDNTVLQNRIDVSSLQKGVYIVNIQNSSQQKTQKIIIN